MVHSSAAEVVSTNPVDRYVKNLATVAARHRIPLVVELFLTAATEEVEPFRHVAVPLVTARQLRAAAELPGPVGVKEYYGIIPERADPNLAVAMAFFSGDRTDADLLTRAAAGYGGAAGAMVEAWTEASTGYELMPWDASWFMREIGRSTPHHTMSAATVRGMQSGADQWNTPSWQSTRRLGYLRTENSEPHPWLLEDVELRCELAIGHLRRAATQLHAAADEVPEELRGWVRRNGAELAAIEVRLRAYVLHLRATNLAATIRRIREAGSVEETLPLIGALRAILVEDLVNQHRAVAADRDAGIERLMQGATEALLREQGWHVRTEPRVGEVEKAIGLLDADPDTFLATFFTVPMTDAAPCGQFSLTSR
jgi:hypothetical protein